MAAASGKEVDEHLLNSAKAVSDAIAKLLQVRKATNPVLTASFNLVRRLMTCWATRTIPAFVKVGKSCEIRHSTIVAMATARDDVLHAGHYLNAAVKGEMTDVASQELLLGV